MQTDRIILRPWRESDAEALCYAFDTEPEKIKAYLSEAGYIFSEEQEQFRAKGYEGGK